MSNKLVISNLIAGLIVKERFAVLIYFPFAEDGFNLLIARTNSVIF